MRRSPPPNLDAHLESARRKCFVCGLSGEERDELAERIRDELPGG